MSAATDLFLDQRYPSADPVRPPAQGLALPATTNRYEIKYLIETKRIPEVRRAIDGFFGQDSNAGADGSYINHSIYFDSPNYRFYREKREGELVRIKPRIRLYRATEDAPPTAIYLELKARYDRIVAKRRAPIDQELAERLLRPGPLDLTNREIENSVIAEFKYLCDRYALRPCVTVLYSRTALNGLYHQNLRFTFDRLIRCSLMTELNNSTDALIEALPASKSILELKYNNQISELLLHKLHSLGLQQQTFSKYAIAIERCHDSFRNQIRTH